MDKTLQDLAWRCLPSEVRKGIKWWYKSEYVSDRGYQPTRTMECLTSLFGHNNLTSDAEGEEMLTVPRSKVQELYTLNVNALRKGNLTDMQTEIATKVKDTLYYLFGPKCLPDEEQSAKSAHCPEPQPSEPKFKVGDTASYVCSPTLKHKCTVTKVMQNEHSSKYEYNVMFEWRKPGMWIPESDLEPYTGPKNEYSERIHAESVQESRIASEESHLRNLSQSMSNCDKHFDTILKDSFSKERRLNIAASIAAGWLACHGMTTPETIAMDALAVADALIIEVKNK